MRRVPITCMAMAAAVLAANVSGAKLALCDSSTLKKVIIPVYSSSLVVACAHSLDMLPKQYLALAAYTPKQCQLLRNNSDCKAVNDAYFAALATISPPCSLRDGSRSDVAVSYEESLSQECNTTKMSRSFNTSTRSNVTSVPIITSAIPRPSAINVDTPPPGRDAVTSNTTTSGVSPSASISLIVSTVALVLTACL
ncbi:hypothetical protein AC1031_020859 [Aphanomyces cochlioides]|nr:hypothetical protein AC1031_020859 [Aphanomyces cochlioides]